MVWNRALPETMPRLDEFRIWRDTSEKDSEETIRMLAVHQAIRIRGGVSPGEKNTPLWVVVVKPGTPLWNPDRPAEVHTTQLLLSHDPRS